MKKIVSILLISVILILCLAVSALAVPRPRVSFNDDFTKMYYNGKTFSRVNAKNIDYSYADLEIPMDDYEYNDGVYTEAYSYGYDIYEVIPNKSHTNVADISVSSNKHANIFEVFVDYTDGSSFYCSFLRDDYRTEYDNMMSGKTDKYTVDFSWSESNEIYIDASKLKTGKTETINYYTEDSYDVYIEAKDKSFRYYSGIILYSNDNFYYFDYLDAGTTYDEFMYGEELHLEIKARVIEDENTLQQLHEGKRLYDEESGYIFDDDFAVGVSKLFFGILLLFIPFVICVGSLVLFVKAKKPAYKKIFATICVLSLLEIIVVVLIIILYNKYINK